MLLRGAAYPSCCRFSGGSPNPRTYPARRRERGVSSGRGTCAVSPPPRSGPVAAMPRCGAGWQPAGGLVIRPPLPAIPNPTAGHRLNTEAATAAAHAPVQSPWTPCSAPPVQPCGIAHRRPQQPTGDGPRSRYWHLLPSSLVRRWPRPFGRRAPYPVTQEPWLSPFQYRRYY